MKPLKLKQNPQYKIIRFEGSEWVRAEYRNEMIGMCMDLTVAYQVIYTHIKDSGRPCINLNRVDFKEIL